MTPTISNPGQNKPVNSRFFTSVKSYALTTFAAFTILGSEGAMAQDKPAPTPDSITAPAVAPAPVPAEAQKPGKLERTFEIPYTYSRNNYASAVPSDEIADPALRSSAKLRDTVIRTKVTEEMGKAADARGRPYVGRRLTNAVNSIMRLNKSKINTVIEEMLAFQKCTDYVAKRQAQPTWDLNSWQVTFEYGRTRRTRQAYTVEVTRDEVKGLDAKQMRALVESKVKEVLTTPVTDAYLRGRDLTAARQKALDRRIKRATNRTMLAGRRGIEAQARNAQFCFIDIEKAGIPTSSSLEKVVAPNETEVPLPRAPSMDDALSENNRRREGDLNALGAYEASPAMAQRQPSMLDDESRVGLLANPILFSPSYSYGIDYSYSGNTGEIDDGSRKASLGADYHDAKLRIRFGSIMPGIGVERSLSFTSIGIPSDFADGVCNSINCSFTQVDSWAAKLSTLFSFGSGNARFMVEPNAKLRVSGTSKIWNISEPYVNSEGGVDKKFAVGINAGIFVPGQFMLLLNGSTDAFAPSSIYVGYNPHRRINLELTGSTVGIYAPEHGNASEAGSNGRFFNGSLEGTVWAFDWLGIKAGGGARQASINDSSGNSFGAIGEAVFKLGFFHAALGYNGNFGDRNLATFTVGLHGGDGAGMLGHAHVKGKTKDNSSPESPYRVVGEASVSASALEAPASKPESEE